MSIFCNKKANLLSLFSYFCFGISLDSLDWVPMSIDSKNIWYTSSEICVLENSNKSLKLHENYKNCKVSYPYFPFNRLGMAERKGWAGDVTRGWFGGGKDCAPFYHTRPHFKMELKGYGASTIKNVTNIVINNSQKNRTLVFIGDSLHRQNYDAFIAEIVRLSDNAVISYYSPIKHEENIGYMADKYKTTLTNLCNFKRYALMDCILIDINNFYSIVYFIWYGEEHTWKSGFYNIEEMTRMYDGVTVVANHGQWLYYKGNYDEHTKNVLNDLNMLKINNPNKKIKLLWRETVAAHFNSPLGYFLR